MIWKLNLSELCEPQLLEAAKALYRKKGIRKVTRTQTADGSWHITAKAMDDFHFVSHPSVVADRFGESVLAMNCDCLESSRGQKICEHVVALTVAMVRDYSDCLYTAYDISQPVSAEPATVPETKSQLPKLEQPQFWSEVLQRPVAEPETKPQLSEPEQSRCRPEETQETVTEPEIINQQPEPTRPARSMRIHMGNRKEARTEDETEESAKIYWYPNDTAQVFHTNMGIIGTMGTGKTQFTKSLITQLYRSSYDNYDGAPFGLLIFDYKGDYNETKTDFVRATNATVLKPYRLPFNPLALNRGLAFKARLPMHTASEFTNTIAKIYRLGPKQRQVLLDCIAKAYVCQGIDMDDPATWNRPAPTIDQVFRIFQNDNVGHADSLSHAMSQLVDFQLFESKPCKAKSLQDILTGVVVVDLSGYDQKIQNLIVAITLNQFYAQMYTQGSSKTDGRYRQLRNLILVDEADFFMREDFPVLRNILKEGREFGVGVVLSTQSLSHFLGGQDVYSRYILTWCAHNVSDLKKKDVEYVFKFPSKSGEIDKFYAIIKTLGKHESVIKIANNDPVVMCDQAFWKLYKELFGI